MTSAATAQRLGGVLATAHAAYPGLSLAQLRVLLAVYATVPPGRPVVLAQELAMPKSTFSVALNGLEAAGLVRRRPCHDHDGHVAIHHTVRGMLLLAALMVPLAETTPVVKRAA